MRCTIISVSCQGHNFWRLELSQAWPLTGFNIHRLNVLEAWVLIGKNCLGLILTLCLLILINFKCHRYWNCKLWPLGKPCYSFATFLEINNYNLQVWVKYGRNVTTGFLPFTHVTYRRILPMDLVREVLLKGEAQYSWPPCTNLFSSAPFIGNDISEKMANVNLTSLNVCNLIKLTIFSY